MKSKTSKLTSMHVSALTVKDSAMHINLKQDICFLATNTVGIKSLHTPVKGDL